ncbi:ABC transporter ATP-binding protein [Babesia caballi]|uniref:ABC transporter ATP-binding protein n=1 Tax=Babesia caballi TaxID=5871 RepID=A0AAV4M376_BABCB|nr:ABC transporter ATP-binding protein [Babesia caballi]
MTLRSAADKVSPGRDVELGLNGAGVVRKANEKARTGSIPQSDAVTEGIMERRLGVLGRFTALDEDKVGGVPVSTPLGGKALGERCDMAVQSVLGWRLGQLAYDVCHT